MDVATIVFRTRVTGGEIPALSALEVDATVSAEHTSPAEVTKNPVERGGDISDNIRLKPRTLKLEGVVTDTPLGEGEDAKPGRAAELYALLERLQSSAALLTVATRRKTYERMAIENLSTTDDARSGSAIRFTAQLVEIRVVEAKTVPVLTRVPSTRPKLKGGKNVGDAAKPPERLISVAKRWGNALGVTTPGKGIAP